MDCFYIPLSLSLSQQVSYNIIIIIIDIDWYKYYCIWNVEVDICLILTVNVPKIYISHKLS